MAPTRNWQESIIASASDGPVVANTTSVSTIIGNAGACPSASLFHENAATYGKIQIPSRILVVGRQLRLWAAGRISNIVTAPGTLALTVYSVNEVAVVADSDTIQLNAVAKVNVPWILEWYLTVRTSDSVNGISFMHQGTWTSESVVGAGVPTATGAGVAMLPKTAPAVGAGLIDPAFPLVTLDLAAQFSVANAGNSIKMHQCRLEVLN